MLRKIIILAFFFYVTSANADSQFECRERTGTVIVDLYLDTFTNFNRMEIRNLRTGFYSFSYPRETRLRCSVNHKCYLSNDGTHEFFLRLDKRDVLENTARFTSIYFEVRNFRTNRIGNEFLNCTKFYVR
jgi:hypothetical protein